MFLSPRGPVRIVSHRFFRVCLAIKLSFVGMAIPLSLDPFYNRKGIGSHIVNNSGWGLSEVRVGRRGEVLVCRGPSPFLQRPLPHPRPHPHPQPPLSAPPWRPLLAPRAPLVPPSVVGATTSPTSLPRAPIRPSTPAATRSTSPPRPRPPRASRSPRPRRTRGRRSSKLRRKATSPPPATAPSPPRRAQRTSRRE
ncbi:hypothetical protein P171DRAFT_237975 [Karstenula rhodostoma CBS 690.94]|uniref:Uncharacterized protein n=1 Tax=Karstenula rhodostoma CBS 690.94 TaxID=1392251 RepID=A0A9P4PNX7_9PLEO|nr:hypothetical protein P171DRAFT_237975 [Karstenula rhodostoma CBS 690.94]